MLHPFRTVVTVEGLAPPIPAAERESAQQGLREMRARLESAPAGQRQAMERVLRPEVRVNSGPPLGG